MTIFFKAAGFAVAALAAGAAEEAGAGAAVEAAPQPVNAMAAAVRVAKRPASFNFFMVTIPF